MFFSRIMMREEFNEHICSECIVKERQNQLTIGTNYVDRRGNTKERIFQTCGNK